MSNLVPPPKYVEYPRDPKYRGQDDIDRLWVMCDGYYWLAWPIVFIWLPAMQGSTVHILQNYLVHLCLDVALIVAAFVFLRAALARVFYAKGWSAWKATCLALLLILPTLCAFVSIPLLAALALNFLPLLGCLFWVHSLLRGEFQKYGMQIPITADNRLLKTMVEQIRARNPVEGTPAPPPQV